MNQRERHVCDAQIGLTIREWFAGMILQGMLAANSSLDVVSAVKSAVNVADLLMAALEKKERPI